jgi:hypothetical protein
MSDSDQGLCLNTSGLRRFFPVFVGFLPSPTGYTAKVWDEWSNTVYSECTLPVKAEATGTNIEGLNYAVSNRYVLPIYCIILLQPNVSIQKKELCACCLLDLM